MKGTITDIQPVSVYQEKVYTQDISLQLSCGVTIRVSDIHMHCDETLIGRRVIANLKADNISELECISREEYEIVPREKTHGFDLLCGRVDDVESESDDTYIIDIDSGCGIVSCHIHRDILDDVVLKLDTWLEFRGILGLYLTNVEILTRGG